MPASVVRICVGRAGFARYRTEAAAMDGAPSTVGPLVLGIPLVLLLFGAVLVGIAVLHQRGLEVAVVGLTVILVTRVAFSPFDLVAHLAEEWGKLVNLLGLLVGFALVADDFEVSRLPELVPRVLPRGALGCFTLLALVWLLSGVLDNIAAAMIGTTVSAYNNIVVFRARLTVQPRLINDEESQPPPMLPTSATRLMTTSGKPMD